MMKRAPSAIAVLVVLIVAAVTALKSDRFAALPRELPPIEVLFSPGGGCTDAIVREINAAKSNVLVQAYSFTSAPIAKAVVAAHKRGVRVEVILDESQETEKYTEADFLVHAGVPTKIDAEHAIAHNKVMILDGTVVITGSFNFTASAERRNAENLLIIRDRQIAEKYAANWQEHFAHSKRYTDRRNPSPLPPGEG
jgi:phosphatidylserine/phosphatidylglycerophosphate/cardiolipin synthase-like enzyme